MIGRTNAGGGGLRLTIKAHAAAPASTQSGRENEIWVVSGTAITHWAVKSTAPTAADLGATAIPSGAVWIVDNGTTNTVDVIKDAKKYLATSPSWCRQYISGSWKDTEAYLYKAGAWVKFSATFDGIIYANGIKNTDLTGGLYYVGAGTVNYNYTLNGQTVLYLYANTGYYTVVTTKNKIDLTNYKKLRATVVKCDYWNPWTIKIAKTITSGWGGEINGPSGHAAIATSKSTGTLDLDISNFSGEYYIGVGEQYNTSAYISKIWLE